MVLLESILTGTTIAIGGGTLLYYYQNELLYPAKYRKKSREFVSCLLFVIYSHNLIKKFLIYYIDCTKTF
jgi:hypothetical protein